jgi:hypothetical protein
MAPQSLVRRGAADRFHRAPSAQSRYVCGLCARVPLCMWSGRGGGRGAVWPSCLKQIGTRGDRKNSRAGQLAAVSDQQQPVVGDLSRQSATLFLLMLLLRSGPRRADEFVCCSQLAARDAQQSDSSNETESCCCCCSTRGERPEGTAARRHRRLIHLRACASCGRPSAHYLSLSRLGENVLLQS